MRLFPKRKGVRPQEETPIMQYIYPVEGGDIKPASIITQALKDGSIATAKIENLAVTNAKIGLLAVDTAQIAGAAIETAKINDLAVTNAKINDCAIGKLTVGNLSAVGTIVSGGKFVTGVSPNPRIEITNTEIVGYSNATTKQFEVKASDGKAYFGGGTCYLDAGGIRIEGAAKSIDFYFGETHKVRLICSADWFLIQDADYISFTDTDFLSFKAGAALYPSTTNTGYMGTPTGIWGEANIKDLKIPDAGFIQYGALTASPKLFGGESDSPYELFLQPSAGNNMGEFAVMPSGTEDKSALVLWNTSDYDNGGFNHFYLFGTTLYIVPGKHGTGTAPTILDIKLNVQPNVTDAHTLGTTTLNWNDMVTKVATLKETTTPSAVANFGKIYTKDTNKLYFQDGAGNEHEVAFAV